MSVPVSVPIGIINQFSVLGSTAVSGATGAGVVVTGDVGSSPTPAISNFPVPSTVVPPFTLHLTNDATVQQAQLDATTTYNFLAAQVPPVVIVGDQLGGLMLTSGIYSMGAGDLTGVLTLNGPGIFIFQTASSLTAAVGSSIVGTASAANIFWQITSSATLLGTSFKGSVYANVSITLGSGSNLTGRAIARTGAVTMSGAGGNTIGGLAVAPPTPDPGYNIQINYTPETTGCHDICYSEVGSPDICCIRDISITPAMVGIPRTIYIQPGITPCFSGNQVIPVGPADGIYSYSGTIIACCGGDPVMWGPADFTLGGV